MPTQMSLFDLPEFSEDFGGDAKKKEETQSEKQVKQNDRDKAVDEAAAKVQAWVAEMQSWLSRPKTRKNSKNWERFEEEVRSFIKAYYAWSTCRDEAKLNQLVGYSQLLVVRIRGRYGAACGLVDNLNPHRTETRHAVVHVEDNYYGGSFSNVKDYEGYVSRWFDEVLAVQAQVCTLADIEPVTRKWVCDNLTCGGDYASYRSKIKTCIKHSTAKSLKDYPSKKSKKK